MRKFLQFSLDDEIVCNFSFPVSTSCVPQQFFANCLCSTCNQEKNKCCFKRKEKLGVQKKQVSGNLQKDLRRRVWTDIDGCSDFLGNGCQTIWSTQHSSLTGHSDEGRPTTNHLVTRQYAWMCSEPPLPSPTFLMTEQAESYCSTPLSHQST